MSNAVSFISSYSNNIQALVNLFNTLRSQNLQITEDPTLIDRYFASPNPRTDINAQDVTNAQNALVQILFTYDSGSPAQSTYLLKMMP